MLLFPKSRPVGVKTESTACEGGVQPGGGSFLAAAHADTVCCQMNTSTSSYSDLGEQVRT